MLNPLHFANMPHFRNVRKGRTACGIKGHVLVLAAVIFAGPAILRAQVCLPALFEVGGCQPDPERYLAPSFATTESRLLYREISNTAPHQVLRNAPDFQRQFRTCPNPEPAGFTGTGTDGIYAAMPSGGYLFVSTSSASDNSAY